MTEEDGKVWKQTIFYPYYHAIRYGQGAALDVTCDCESYSTAKHSAIPYVEAVATINEKEDELTVFAVNRSLKDACPLSLSLDKEVSFQEHLIMTGDDVKAVNSAEEEKITESKRNDGDDIVLPPLSWNVIRFKLV